MIKAFKALLVGVTFLMLSGCANLSWTTAGKIVPPANDSCPLEGKWSVVQDLTTRGDSGGGNQNWVGNTAQFTKGIAMLSEYVWSNPTYKMKKVDSTDYLMTKYLNISSSLVPSSKEVDVITVSAADNFLGEFMKIDDAKVIAFVQNKALYLEKVSDQVDNSLATANPNEFNANGSDKPGTSGVLVGLKIPTGADKDERNKEFTYQTLWLAAGNKKLHPILMGNNIFFPRSSGFWELDDHKIQKGAETEDELSAHDVTTKLPVQEVKIRESRKQMTMDQGTQARIIDYVGNDYVAIETGSGDLMHLQVLPVDKISASTGIKLSDLLGNNGLTAYSSARAQPLRVLSNEGVTLLNEDKFEENFGLTRKNGHWYLQGRINYQKGSQEANYLDYNVNLIPPAKLISYDTLCLSWQNIKDRIPDAVDAFTSPNRDIALVITKNKLYVYGISSDLLDSEPIAKIELQFGESVVMAEWATGSYYVDNWEKAFLANGAKVLPED